MKSLSLPILESSPVRLARPPDAAEFAPGASQWPDDLSRRDFLNVMAASIALAGIGGCSRFPEKHIVPYVEQPERVVPGIPLYFATAHNLDGYGMGIIVQSREGRPTKVEGNPNHPASLGATDVFAQASVLDLYDPDRSQAVRFQGEVATWAAFQSALREQLAGFRQRAGAGLALLTANFTSPTFFSQINALLQQMPQMRWYVHDAANPLRNTAREDAIAVYSLDRADVIVALDSDFMTDEPGRVRYARDFANGRRIRADQTSMNRLYVAEPVPTVTGSNADARLACRASQIEGIARAIAQQIGLQASASTSQASAPSDSETWIQAVADDLKANRGRCVVMCGRTQPQTTHRLVRAINQTLGNVGSTVRYVQPFDAVHDPRGATLETLVADIGERKIRTLIIMDSNPVYDAPAELRFGEIVEQVPLRIHHGLYQDETAHRCHWHAPATHDLETWSDIRAYDGTVTLIQPLIAPLFQGVPRHEFLAAILGEEGVNSRDIVRAHWRQQVGEENFENWWSAALREGLVRDFNEIGQAAESDESQQAAKESTQTAPAAPGEVEIVFRLDPRMWDGRFANNAWLQELPKPLTKLTWDNAAFMSPALAERMGLDYGDVVVLRCNGGEVRAPVWVLPGMADNTVAVELGYGRMDVGRVANGAGFNAYALRSAATPWFQSGVEISKTGDRLTFAVTQPHQVTHGRNEIQHSTIQEFRADPESTLAKASREPNESLFPKFEYTGYKWGMNIDLTVCIGCGTCTIACQAENNIPVVGREGVLRQREMHWIRVDRFFAGSEDELVMLHAPIPCMHCETAPCELVCPVAATIHSSEGLNLMVYNRCIGTRYCSNNCPYKVRRFNFFDYVPDTPEVLNLQRNPNVTVRDRGVMEKCTYCVQRIETARIEARKSNRAIEESEVVPACAQACPTAAIVFGDLNNPSHVVSKLSRQPHDYGMLVELNTRPRTTYLARLQNPPRQTGGQTA